MTTKAERRRVRFEPKGTAPSEPMSADELRAANEQYYRDLVELIGKEAADREIESYISRILRLRKRAQPILGDTLAQATLEK